MSKYSIQGFIEVLNRRPTWTTNAIKSMIGNIHPEEKDLLSTQVPESSQVIPPVPQKVPDPSDKRYYQVPIIKRYDIVHVDTFGSRHFVLVTKVKGDLVWGLCITSKEKNTYTPIKIEKERRLAGSFITSTIICSPLEHCKERFVGSWECKKEAREAIRTISEYIRSVL